MSHAAQCSVSTFPTRILVILTIALLALSACNSAVPLPPTVTATATATPTLLPVQPCAWQWASQALPEIGTTVENALVAAGWNSTRVRAEAYGENCITEEKISRFAAMTTDFYLTVPIEPAVGKSELGSVGAAIYTDLLPILVDLQIPARPGYLDITFTMSGQELHTRLMFDAIQQKLNAGQTLAEILTP